MMEEEKLHPYKSKFLRYRHNVLTGEFINIGLLYYSQKDNYLNFVITTDLDRVKGAFKLTDLTFIKNVIEYLRIKFSNIYSLDDEEMFGKNFDDIANTLLANEDGSFIWSDTNSGVTPSHDKMFDYLFNCSITQYNV